jgi:hypothetical protein
LRLAQDEAQASLTLAHPSNSKASEDLQRAASPARNDDERVETATISPKTLSFHFQNTKNQSPLGSYKFR